MSETAKAYAFTVYRKSPGRALLDPEELHGLAWEGFLLSLRKFNPDGGKSFSSYLYQALFFHIGHASARQASYYNKFPSFNPNMEDHTLDMFSEDWKQRAARVVEKTRESAELLALTSPRQAEALHLRYIVGLPLPVIGLEMGITKNSANQTIQRGLNDLRKKVTRSQADALTQL